MQRFGASHRHSSHRSLVLTCLALLLAFPLSARATTAWVASSLDKIRPSVVSGSGSAATLSAARNEFEAFQVVVAGPVTGVSVTATTLSGPGTIAQPRLFREELITLTNMSGPDGATGQFPDALVPDVDDVVGEKRNAFPFDVPAGQNRVVWVETHVPTDTAPGVYQGSVSVHAAGQADVVIPVTLTVWDFALPSTSSLKSHFGMYYPDLVQAHGVTGDALSTVRARYAQLGLDHRISIGGVDDGNTDLNHFAQYYGPLVDGTAATQLKGAKLTTVQYMGPRATSGYASWTTFFKSKGWFDRLFDYTCDEPPATCNWSDIPARNAMMKAADPNFRSLVTTDVQDATANNVLSSIDILVPVVNYMYDKPGMTFSGLQRPKYDSFLASDTKKELWMYQSCMSHGCGGTSSYFSGWVSYAIDATSIRARGMEWLSFLYKATGELYWETAWAFENGDAWSNQWYFGGNGDGTLLYPGTPTRIGGQTHIPVASIRLKMMREGMEDFEYLKALADAGDPALAYQLAGSLFPNPWTQPSSADLLAARAQIAQRILQLTGKTAPTAVASTGTASTSATTTTTVATTAPSTTTTTTTTAPATTTTAAAPTPTTSTSSTPTSTATTTDPAAAGTGSASAASSTTVASSTPEPTSTTAGTTAVVDSASATPSAITAASTTTVDPSAVPSDAASSIASVAEPATATTSRYLAGAGGCAAGGSSEIVGLVLAAALLLRRKRRAAPAGASAALTA